MSAVVDTAAAEKPRASIPPHERTPARSSAPARKRAHIGEITQPILFKGRSTLAAVLLTLRAAAPATVSTLMLYVIARRYLIPSAEVLGAVTLLVTVLSIVLLQPSRTAAADLLSTRWRIACDLSLRWIALMVVLVVIAYATGYVPRYPSQAIAIWAIATLPLMIAATLGLHEIARRALCRPQNHRNAVFVGCNDTSLYLAESFSRHSELCMAVQGFFDDRGLERLKAPTALKLLGPLSELPAFIRSNDVDVIFISLPLRHIRRVHDLLDALGDTTVSLYYLPDVMVSEFIQARTGEILGAPVIALRETPYHGYLAVAKRAMDVTIATTALLILAPLLLAIAIAVKLTSPGPVVFRQRRYGLDGREIVIYKFRTMNVVEDSGWLDQAQRNDARVTALGRILRRFSLDEFPQLINVLQGRMSLVGPRPHAVGHNEAYRRLIKGYMIRHKVPPGITGLAQVKGYRGETRALKDMQARVDYDLEYLRNWSLWLDVKILITTIPRLFNADKAC